MSLRINTNITALSALRSLNSTTEAMSRQISRLSTGLRINNAADDPAGLIISENLRTQMLGIDQATRNAQDAVNMAKTAEAALEEVQTLIRNMRGLAVHSANTAVVDANMLQANQAQIRNAIQSINRIASQTSWGTRQLLDGSAGAQANVTNGAAVGSIYMGGMFNGESVATGPITMTRVTAGERAAVSLGNTFASVNAIVPTPGAFVINGFSFSTDGAESVQSLLAKINAMSSSTGVTAQFNGGSIQLTAGEFGSRHAVNFFDPSNILHTASSATDTGVDAVFDVSMNTDAGIQTATFTGDGLRLRDGYGNIILLTEQGNATAGVQSVGMMTAGSVNFHIGAGSNQSVAYSLPNAYANRLGTGVIANMDLSQVDVTTQTGAQQAIQIIDAAVSQLGQWRGDLGSFQVNFLESTIRSLGVVKENLAASESQIRDADMAMEMTSYTKYQILQQSGMAMLAQANQAPTNVLQLLQQ
ncbi:MAG: hypothetical protein JNK63_03575 [Chthonomonas sp.]|nr:hypothetical protein [Chthonomonas sp.]